MCALNLLEVRLSQAASTLGLGGPLKGLPFCIEPNRTLSILYFFPSQDVTYHHSVSSHNLLWLSRVPVLFEIRYVRSKLTRRLTPNGMLCHATFRIFQMHSTRINKKNQRQQERRSRNNPRQNSKPGMLSLIHFFYGLVQKSSIGLWDTLWRLFHLCPWQNWIFRSRHNGDFLSKVKSINRVILFEEISTIDFNEAK